MSDKTIDKLLSGRFWLTIITGFVFAYAVVKEIIPAGSVDAIIVMVFMSYFYRDRKNGNGVKK